ncbi:MAG: efflux RND transporter periplasmic adaptor subunit [Gemmatimonadota bacterium]
MDIPRKAPSRTRRRIVIGSVTAAGVVFITLALSRLSPAAPTVERSTVWIDTVKRGEMLRQVRGPGTLVPEQIRWIPAVTAGRVEQILVEPGTEVTADTPLLVLTNPDVQLEALEAQRQLAQAEADYLTLKAQLETQILEQRASAATVEAQFNDARRRAEASTELADKGLIAALDAKQAQERANEMETRHELEGQRLGVSTRTIQAQLAVQTAQVERLRAIAEFRRQMVESMRVIAGADGVVQELPFEIGQYAQPGAVLAKVVQPGKLKAELRIPETQAKDITLGQRAAIDTRNGIIPGHVVRIDPAVQQGTVTVDVALDGPLPRGARPDLSVDGTLEIEKLDDVLYVGRPAYGQGESVVGIFKLEPDGEAANRVQVKLGKSSVNTIEVQGGLEQGDRVILSDMSAWDAVDRIRLN